MDMKIDLVEEAFALLAKYQIQLTKEESEKVDSLSYNWLQLQGKAMDVQLLLLTVQEHFQKELIANLKIFENDCKSFVDDYNGNGPMQPGLTPKEASDRLQASTSVQRRIIVMVFLPFFSFTFYLFTFPAQMFQNHFDALWRKHNSYTIGEDLFGLPHSEQPELNRIKKELNLLQRLYKLYNDVIDSVNGYHNIPWQDVNIEEINNELMEFQNR
jgi:dynein heavy chain